MNPLDPRLSPARLLAVRAEAVKAVAAQVKECHTDPNEKDIAALVSLLGAQLVGAGFDAAITYLTQDDPK